MQVRYTGSMSSLPKLKTRFPEPVVDSGADPYVVVHDDYFYYCHVQQDKAIFIRKAKTLDDIGKAEAIQVWPLPGKPFEESIWAPELHRLDGKWYIYFANGPKVEHYSQQRMYVVEGIGDDPQTAQYSMKGKIADSTDQWAIDGTVLNMPDGQRYFVWSGWDTQDNMVQNLYVAKMSNPWTLLGERVRIASPVFPWESQGLGINEGPQILPHGDSRHIIYSASHSLTDYYCLGQITLVGPDPLEPTHWIKHLQPVYQSHKGLIAPGHASFVLTPDEAYGWMIFHTARHAGAGWDRQVRLAAFEMTPDGTPVFMPTKSLFDQLGQRLSLVDLLHKMVRR
jgi:GH43 family beta-xylosidase